MFKKLLRPLAAVALLAAPLAASADHLRPHLLLTARLSGAQEVPAVATAGQGVAAITVNATRDTIFIQAAVSNLSGPVTGVHFHDAPVGMNAPVSVNLISMLRGNRVSGFLAGAQVTPLRIARLVRGLVYLNVHTAANPGGEIRGQVTVESDDALAGVLSGAQEVPAVATTASGLGVFTLSQDQERLKFRVVVAGLSGAITGAHFHIAGPGANAPVALNLTPFLSGNVLEGEISSQGATPLLTPALRTALVQGGVYINFHTAANPGGEIRAQVLPERRVLPLDARFDGAQMVPAVTTTASAVSVGRLVGTLDTVRVQVAYTGLSGRPVDLRFYAANAGVANTPANLVGVVPVIPGVGGNTVGNVITFEITAPTLTPALANLLLNTGINTVLTTAANPNGEIRGQVIRLAREGYSIVLNGAQERPTPVATAGYGVGFVSVDRDQTNARFAAVWGGLSGPATAGHFHTGSASQSGGVVFNLISFFDNATTPTSLAGYWKSDNAVPFDASRSLLFRNENIYLNLHTATNPGGEIRGQVYRGARNLQVVLATQPAAVLPETFSTAPNPFSSALTLSFDARFGATGQLRITDMLGRTVAAQAVAVRAGANSVPLALPGVAPGVYLLTLRIGESQVVTRIVK
ncbi:CHRD domain-containing protein [Hymenobacter antarcticus]|uniref:CHRD domain-containing protein n=1 Tax=Hymenobacter antarcticus TaxID=486270 RepID=A0ABP7QEJ6_9BACT